MNDLKEYAELINKVEMIVKDQKQYKENLFKNAERKVSLEREETNKKLADIEKSLEEETEKIHLLENWERANVDTNWRINEEWVTNLEFSLGHRFGIDYLASSSKEDSLTVSYSLDELKKIIEGLIAQLQL